jgi:tRNA (guanine-N7-)-methyltransferase
VGIDVHTPGIAAVLEAVRSRGLRNIRVVEGDVIDFSARIPQQSLSGIRVFFPDPWPKRRQRGRRLIRPEVMDQLVPLLRTGATLHLATDVDDYAAQMQAVCDAVPGLVGGVVARPAWRPVTRYEQRAIDEGRHPVDLIYISSDSSPSASSSAER